MNSTYTSSCTHTGMHTYNTHAIINDADSIEATFTSVISLHTLTFYFQVYILFCTLHSRSSVYIIRYNFIKLKLKTIFATYLKATRDTRKIPKVLNRTLIIMTIINSVHSYPLPFFSTIFLFQLIIPHPTPPILPFITMTNKFQAQ